MPQDLPPRSLPCSLTPKDLTGKITKVEDQYCASGSFGDVYRCQYHSELGAKEVAVKTFRFEFTLTEEDVSHGRSARMIRRELGIWKRLSHDNIVPFLGIVYGFGRLGNVSVVSSWMPHGTLQQFLSKYDLQLTVAHRLQLLLGIANGLEYLHSLSIIHGDLTGTNVLLDEKCNVRLTDFGYASLVGEIPEALAYLQTSTLRPGNVRWTAPECLSLNPREVSPLTIKSDIFSFGNIALQTLSGKQPWSECSRNEIVVVQLAMGHKPQRPQSRPIDDRHWSFIEQCWLPVKERPSAEHLVSSISEFSRAYPHSRQFFLERSSPDVTPENTPTIVYPSSNKLTALSPSTQHSGTANDLYWSILRCLGDTTSLGSAIDDPDPTIKLNEVLPQPQQGQHISNPVSTQSSFKPLSASTPQSHFDPTSAKQMSANLTRNDHVAVGIPEGGRLSHNRARSEDMASSVNYSTIGDILSQLAPTQETALPASSVNYSSYEDILSQFVHTQETALPIRGSSRRSSSSGSRGDANETTRLLYHASPYPRPSVVPRVRYEGPPSVPIGKQSSMPQSDTQQLNNSPVITFPWQILTSDGATSVNRRRKPDASFLCPVPGCGSTFTRSFNLKGHMRSHNEGRPFQCEWPGCGKGFARQHDCKRHEQLHSNYRPFTCEGCNKTFARMDALNRHLRSEDGAECQRILDDAKDSEKTPVPKTKEKAWPVINLVI